MNAMPPATTTRAVRQTLVTWAQVGPWLPAALLLSAAPAWAQTGPQDAPQADPNAQVLQAWQEQTGQAAWVNDDGQLEFHGAVTVDVYDNRKNIPSGNAVLSALPEGSFGRAVLQADVRKTSSEGDVTYVQAVTNSSNDRSAMPRYNPQMTSFQAGRAGPGYQVAVGDVVAGFSGLSSSLGLRGLLGARQVGSTTLTGFAGTVSETWETLFNFQALDGFAPRSRYLRDVVGGKAELQYSETLSAFATMQGWRDETSSASLTPGATALNGTSVTVGGKYATDRAQVTLEAAQSGQQDVSTGGVGFGPPAGVASTSALGNGTAFTLDGTYRWNAWGLRAGYHDLSTGYASLAQTVAPGVHEGYIGADWNITPALGWSTDVRQTLARTAATAYFAATSNQFDSLNNRLNYTIAALPGLVLGVSDTRNNGKDANGNTNSNTLTMYTVGYASGFWNTQIGAGNGSSRSPISSAADSDSSQWQFSLGRSFMDSTHPDRGPAWTAFAQFFSSGQNQQLINSGTTMRSTMLGLSASLQSGRFGNFNASLQHQVTVQPVAGKSDLITQTLNFDWSRALSAQWSLKAYARLNHRNYGDILLRADEQVIGMQTGYQW
jgi:hypothetical protein